MCQRSLLYQDGEMIEHYLAARNEITGPGSPFAVTTEVVRGVTLKSFAAAPPNMRSMWEMSAVHGDKDYLVYEDERFTYNEMHAMVRKLAQHLVAHGVGSGTRVALAMRNYPEWVAGYWATISIGAAAVGMNAWWTAPEMEYALNDSAPLVLIADDERLERFQQLTNVPPMHVISVRTDRAVQGDGVRWADVMSADDPGVLPDATIDPDDDATIFYTSGTTGFPKGAQLTHRGSVANIFNIAAMGAITTAAEQKAVALGEVTAAPAPAVAYPPSFMAPTPLFHVTACNCLLHPATLVGGKVVMTYKWDPGRALELIERERITNFSGVPSMSRELLMHPDWSTR
ncbi:MAG: hypothetical protein RI898_563, partial [Actinomycetota bacterium]